MLRRVGLGRCWVESAWVDVELRRSGPMSSGVDLGRCLAESAWADVERSRPEPVSSKFGPRRCRTESVWADVEPSWSGPMSSGVSRAHVESSRPGTMSNKSVRFGLSWSASRLSRLRPSSSQISLYPYQNGSNVIDKVNLI